MSGFLADYATTTAGAVAAGQIMQSFGLPDAFVINELARRFAARGGCGSRCRDSRGDADFLHPSVASGRQGSGLNDPTNH